jgi:hypothetical protein
MMLWLLTCCAWVRACCFRNLVFCARRWRVAWVRVLLQLQHCCLRVMLAQRLGAGAGAPAALFAAHGVGEALWCAYCCSRSIDCCARRLHSTWVRVLLVPQHCLLRGTLAQR